MAKFSLFLLFSLLFCFSSCLLQEVKEVERKELHVLLSKDLLADSLYFKDLGKRNKLKLIFYNEETAELKNNEFDLLLSSNIYRSSDRLGGLFAQIDRRLLRPIDRRFVAQDRRWFGLHYNPHLIMVSKTISQDSLKTMEDLSALEWQNAIQFPSSKNPLSVSLVFQLALKLGENNASALVKKLEKGDTLRFYDGITEAKTLLRLNRFTAIYTTQKEYITAKKDSALVNFKPYLLWTNKGGSPYELYGLAQLRSGKNKKNQSKLIRFLTNRVNSQAYAQHDFSVSCLSSLKAIPTYGMSYSPSIEAIKHIKWQEQYQKSKRFIKGSKWKSQFWKK